MLATGLSRVREEPEEYEILAETISIVQMDDVPKVRTSLQSVTQIAIEMESAPGPPDGTLPPWQHSPVGNKKSALSLGHSQRPAIS